jgi:ABC-2 type transport system permease protein
MFMGISVIWDREFGFMKEILVAPIPRYTLFLGKMFGDSINAILQGLITFAFGALLGIPFEALAFLACIPIMLLMTFGLTSIGLTLASFIGSLENFGAIQTFVNLPLFFLSGALFPVTQNLGAPLWLSVASAFNPVSYGVDALRTVLLGSAWIPTNPLFVNLGVLAIFDVVMIGVGTWAFSRMK